MVEAGTAVRFASHAEFREHLAQCIAQSNEVLLMFDPDFSVFPLGSVETDGDLRAFLKRGGVIRLALHRPGHIEREYPRFLRLLKDYSHRIECRATSRSLHHLTDSFCIGDRENIVRRFHADHMRGEAAFALPEAAEVSLERFEGIWAESVLTLQPTVTGL